MKLMGFATDKPGNELEYILCKIHVHGRRHDTIIPRIEPIADVKGRPAPQVVHHAAEELDLPPSRGTLAAATAAMLACGCRRPGKWLDCLFVRVGRHCRLPQANFAFSSTSMGVCKCENTKWKI